MARSGCLSDARSASSEGSASASGYTPRAWSVASESSILRQRSASSWLIMTARGCPSLRQMTGLPATTFSTTARRLARRSRVPMAWRTAPMVTTLLSELVVVTLLQLDLPGKAVYARD